MGGTSGMGWAAAKKFVAEGAHVLSVGKPQETDFNDENKENKIKDNKSNMKTNHHKQM